MNVNLKDLENKLRISFPKLKSPFSIKKIGDGYESIVIETNDNIVFKIAKNHIVRLGYKKEKFLLLFLSKKIDSIQIPYPEYYIESSKEFTYGLIGYKKIKGGILDPKVLKENSLPKIASQIAYFLYQLHKIEVRHLNFSAIPYFPENMKDTWKNVSAWLHSNLKNYQFITIREWWHEAECFWKASDLKPTLVHGDLWYSNVLIDKKIMSQVLLILVVL